MDVRLPQRSLVVSPGNSGDTTSHNSTDPSPDNSRSASPTNSPPVSPHSIDIPEPIFPIAEISTDPGAIPDHSDWSVEYNPEITQILRISLDKTLTFPASVYYAKFSHDGKYFAVGLRNGETHIHDMMTGSKRLFLLSVVCRPFTNLAFMFSVLVKSSHSIFYTEAAVKPPDIWALRFSLDNKYIITAGGSGEIDVLKLSLFFVEYEQLIREF